MERRTTIKSSEIPEHQAGSPGKVGELKKTIGERLNGYFSKYTSIIAFLTLVIAVVSLTMAVNAIEIVTKIENSYNNTSIINDDSTTIYWGEEESDYLSKARKGDLYSQLWVAEHDMELGNYADALYWYKIASENGQTGTEIALNNLGYLYARGYGLSDYGEFDGRRYDQALILFIKASDMGLEVATQNAIEILKLPGYSCEVEDVHDFLAEHDYSVEGTESYVVKSRYFVLDNPHGATYTHENYHCTYSGSMDVSEIYGGPMRTGYAYYGVIYNTDGMIERCKFVRLDDLQLSIKE